MPSKRILFLDDCPARQRWALANLAPGNWYAGVLTAEEAIAALAMIHPAGPFDEVYLDHDLGDEVYVDSSRKDCGFEVVRWIVANRPKIGRIVVHTMNTPAGNLMGRALKRAGYRAKYVSFYRLGREGVEAIDD